MTSRQIFSYLPQGIADGLGISIDNVIMNSLVPYDTQAQLGYVTTLALLYIPQSMVNTLSLDIHIPTSQLYNDPDPSVNTMMRYINSAIPITAGATLASSGSGASTGSDSSADSSSNSGSSSDGGVFNDNTQQSASPSTKSTTAGIAVGTIGAAAAYGAAMFFIARRYKKRKQGHRRASSLVNPSEMRQTGSPALMGGAYMAGARTSTPASGGQDRNSRGSGRSVGNSARTQLISAPMAAENSLGWN